MTASARVPDPVLHSVFIRYILASLVLFY